MVEKSITGIVTWLKNWFYDSGQIDEKLGQINTAINGKASQSDLNTLSSTVSGKAPTNHASANNTYGLGTSSQYGHVKVDESLDSQSVNPVRNSAVKTELDKKITKTITDTGFLKSDGSVDGSSYSLSNHNHSGVYAPVSHEQATTTITNNQAYNNIKSGESSTLTLTSQKLINDAINTRLGELSNINFIVFGENPKPTASANTMGYLLVINEDNKINFYYTRDKGASANPRYEWEKMDTDILDELVVNWSDVQGKPSTFTPSSHTHGNINNLGVMTDTPDTTINNGYLLVTGSDGVIKRSQTIYSGFMKSVTGYDNIGTNAQDSQYTINGAIDTALGNKISKSSTTGLVKNDGTVMTSGTGSSNWAVGNHTHSTYGLKTDDIDWSYNSNGFVNGIKLHDKTATGDDATGTITFHLKS